MDTSLELDIILLAIPVECEANVEHVLGYRKRGGSGREANVEQTLDSLGRAPPVEMRAKLILMRDKN